MISTGPIRVLMSSTSFPATVADWQGRFIANMAEALARRNEIALSLWAPPGGERRPMPCARKGLAAFPKLRRFPDPEIWLLYETAQKYRSPGGAILGCANLQIF